MAAVSLFWDTNMPTVTSCENTPWNVVHLQVHKNKIKESNGFRSMNYGLSEFRIYNKKGASNSVFEGRTSTESGLFASLISGLVETLRQIVFIREKKDGF